jgi:hypothetical protein
MTEKIQKGFWTTDIKAVTYLRLRGRLTETSVSENPQGFKTFYYTDSDRVREIMQHYKSDTDFHRQFDCYYEVIKIIRGKNENLDKQEG